MTYLLDAADLGYLVLGIVFLALGSITLLLTILRSASRDAVIFLFGIMSSVWGLRFLFYTDLVPLLLTGDPHALEQVARALTYFGGAAAFGFACAFLGPGHRQSIRILTLVSLLFSLVAAVALIVNPNRDLLMPAFSVLVILGTLVIIANTLRQDLRRQPRLQGLNLGFGLAIVFFVLENLRALELVPLSFDVEWVGVLILYFTLGRLIGRRLFTNERRLAAIRQELATARRIQASLLPRQAPRIAGLTLAARYVPMEEVVGDIYDFVAMEGVRQSILVADVSGHGIAAALIASLVKGAYRAQAAHLDRPELVLAGMNRILTGQLDREFVTAGCAYIDAEAGLLRYAGAGHPPLLICPRDGRNCAGLQENGLILGQFVDAAYDSVEHPLAPGDRLLLYTDGILEATDGEERQFGERKLRKFIAGNRELPAEELADALLRAVTEWSEVRPGGSLEDDLTLVVVDTEI
jgi:phosphoserine phosphatase RsbU/P